MNQTASRQTSLSCIRLGRQSCLFAGIASLGLIMAVAGPTTAGEFLPNQGQWTPQVQFAAFGPHGSLYVTETGFVLDLAGAPAIGTDQAERVSRHALWFTFAESTHAVRASSHGASSSSFHYVRGGDPPNSVITVESCSSIDLSGLWHEAALNLRLAGGDLWMAVTGSRRPEGYPLDLEIAGEDGAFVDEFGRTVLRAGVHTVTLAWDAIQGEGRISWGLGPSRPAPEPRDEGLLWSTFLGGGGYYDYGAACADDNTGNIIVTGRTSSGSLPATAGAYDVSYNGAHDAFLAKLSADGAQLLWCTFLGGSGWDAGRSLAVDSGGEIYVTGTTGSADFPVTPGAFATTTSGENDAFAAHLSPDGSELIWSTYLGGDLSESGSKIALAPGGDVVLAGTTQSDDFPTTPGAYDRTYAQGMHPTFGDCFVTALTADGTELAWSTYLGGPQGSSGGVGYGGEDVLYDLCVDLTGASIVVGRTESPGFPVTAGAWDENFDAVDGFVAALASDGSALLWSTFLGGSDTDECRGVCLAAGGDVYVAGNTQSTDLPATAGAFQTEPAGLQDGFLVRLTGAGSQLAWGTYLGGSAFETMRAMQPGPNDAVVLLGRTNSGDYPTTPDAFDPSINGDRDAFVTCVRPLGDELFYSTYLGGSDRDEPEDLLTDATGALSVTGYTLSVDFPITPGAFDTTHNGGYDAFITQLFMPWVAAVGDMPVAEQSWLRLERVTPQPALEAITLTCTLGRSDKVQLTIHDVLGRTIYERRSDRLYPPGTVTLAWDGRDKVGRQVSPGAYFASVRAGSHIVTRRIIVAP